MTATTVSLVRLTTTRSTGATATTSSTAAACTTSALAALEPTPSSSAQPFNEEAGHDCATRVIVDGRDAGRHFDGVQQDVDVGRGCASLPRRTVLQRGLHRGRQLPHGPSRPPRRPPRRQPVL